MNMAVWFEFLGCDTTYNCDLGVNMCNRNERNEQSVLFVKKKILIAAVPFQSDGHPCTYHTGK